jgi:hypothetical protein
MVDDPFTKCRNGTIFLKWGRRHSQAPPLIRSGAPPPVMARGGMAEPQIKASRAGGVIIAATILAGAITGVVYREPSIGILAGAAAGIAITLALYLRDRRRGKS